MPSPEDGRCQGVFAIFVTKICITEVGCCRVSDEGRTKKNWYFGAHGTRTCIKRQKIAYGNFFDFWADEYIYKRIPEDENPPIEWF